MDKALPGRPRVALCSLQLQSFRTYVKPSKEGWFPQGVPLSPPLLPPQHEHVKLLRDAQLCPRILGIPACLSGCLDSNGLSLTSLGSHQHVASSCLTLCHVLCSSLARLWPFPDPWLPFSVLRAFLLCSHGLVCTLPCCFHSYLVLIRNGLLADSFLHWGHSPCGLLVPAQQLSGLCFRAGSLFTS